MVLTGDVDVDVKENALLTVNQIMTTPWFDWRDIKVKKSTSKLVILTLYLSRKKFHFYSNKPSN
jgi:hypothetical protein